MPKSLKTALQHVQHGSTTTYSYLYSFKLLNGYKIICFQLSNAMQDCFNDV